MRTLPRRRGGPGGGDALRQRGADLIEEYLDTRLPEEMEHYTHGGAGDRAIVKRALSNEVITPGTHHGGRRARCALRHALGRTACAPGSSPTCACSARRRHRHLARLPRGGARAHVIEPATWCTSTSASPTWASTPTGRRWPTCSSPVRPTRPRGLKQAMAQHQHAAGRAHAAARAPGLTGGEVFRATMAEMRRARHRGDDLLAPDRRAGARARRQHRLPQPQKRSDTRRAAAAAPPAAAARTSRSS
jgi:hypothetical protein